MSICFLQKVSSHHMLLLSRLLLLAGSVNYALSAPTRIQGVLGQNEPPIPPQPNFGVGFDLTASYGSAAVSFANGTTITIAKITALEGYNKVLTRLSLASSRHPSPPYNNLGESWDDMQRQYLRRSRKSIGLPASSDVGFLADMLSSLRACVEARVGPITSAGVTIPHLIALYNEDLHDAFEYLGLEYITFNVGYPGHQILYQTSAAYAGYGFGLCSNYEDEVACKDEQRDMPETVVMAVLYTRTVLTLSLSKAKSAYSLWEPSNRYLIFFELGYDTRNERDENEYWNKVKLRLGQIMIENPFYERPAKVLLMGDYVEDEIFQKQLLEALDDQMDDLPEILRSNSDVIAARGVAEFAKRQPFKSSEV